MSCNKSAKSIAVGPFEALKRRSDELEVDREEILLPLKQAVYNQIRQNRAIAAEFLRKEGVSWSRCANGYFLPHKYMLLSPTASTFTYRLQLPQEEVIRTWDPDLPIDQVLQEALDIISVNSFGEDK